MLEQVEAKYSYTIPYYTNKFRETSEIFVSEKTYETYLTISNTQPFIVIDGSLHPISTELGEVTTTLFDPQKAIIIIGKTDLDEYTNEILDITVAAELEKVKLFNKHSFTHFIYSDKTPELMMQFIDDIQQTLQDIHISKRLISKGYRIHERENEFAKDYLLNAIHFKSIRDISPYQNKEALYLITKLIYLTYVDSDVFLTYKKQLKPNYPALFLEVDKLLKLIQKVNFSHDKGREKALIKIFKHQKLNSYVKKITIKDINEFKIF